jgi:hypothetical protein
MRELGVYLCIKLVANRSPRQQRPQNQVTTAQYRIDDGQSAGLGRVYFPIVTSIVLSVVLTLILIRTCD